MRPSQSWHRLPPQPLGPLPSLQSLHSLQSPASANDRPERGARCSRCSTSCAGGARALAARTRHGCRSFLTAHVGAVEALAAVAVGMAVAVLVGAAEHRQFGPRLMAEARPPAGMLQGVTAALLVLSLAMTVRGVGGVLARALFLAALAASAWFTHQYRAMHYAPAAAVSDNPPSYAAYLITSSGTMWRLSATLHELERTGINPEVIVSPDVRTFPDAASVFANMTGRPTKETPLALNGYTRRDALILSSHRDAWRRAAARTPQPDWALVFEDDAHLIQPFLPRLLGVLQLNERADVVFLDVRSAFTAGLGLGLSSGAAGIAYRISSLSMLEDAIVDYDSEPRREARRAISEYAFDVVLAWICNAGYLQCGAAALVNEGDFGLQRTPWW